jgi:hypothetical protein
MFCLSLAQQQHARRGSTLESVADGAHPFDDERPLGGTTVAPAK